jgi:hypothetical protein
MRCVYVDIAVQWGNQGREDEERAAEERREVEKVRERDKKGEKETKGEGEKGKLGEIEEETSIHRKRQKKQQSAEVHPNGRCENAEDSRCMLHTEQRLFDFRVVYSVV